MESWNFVYEHLKMMLVMVCLLGAGVKFSVGWEKRGQQSSSLSLVGLSLSRKVKC